ncbi:hypothetical protein, partial [Pseudomonas syringae]|uniref:hypothetical protein n=1 Tax=Pseudomonas syringae TaxID=317 RepID=UPI001F3759D1
IVASRSGKLEPQRPVGIFQNRQFAGREIQKRNIARSMPNTRVLEFRGFTRLSGVFDVDLTTVC